MLLLSIFKRIKLTFVLLVNLVLLVSDANQFGRSERERQRVIQQFCVNSR